MIMNDEINLLMPEVRHRIEESLPEDWPELGELVREHLSGHPLPPPVILPLASCAAVGSRPERAIPTAAAWALLLLSLRWFDDAQDQDRPDAIWTHIGIPRATNMAAVVLSLSWKILTSSGNEKVPNAILSLFAETAIELSAGQDRDLRGGINTVDECWKIMKLKCGAYFALAARAGAMHGTNDKHLIDACGSYGEHVGTAVQILDDLEGVFYYRGKGDLALNKVTLPVIYGMTVDHAGRDELRMIVETGELALYAARIRELLDRIDTRKFILWAALKEREKAVKALRACPERKGTRILEYFVNTLFEHMEGIL